MADVTFSERERERERKKGRKEERKKERKREREREKGIKKERKILFTSHLMVTFWPNWVSFFYFQIFVVSK